MPPQVVSISWGSTEQGVDDGNPDGVSGGESVYITMTETQLAALGAMGVTMIAASGDNGASGDGNPNCVYTSAYPQFLYVSWPASSPHVVAVGATTLNGVSVTYTEPSTPWCGMKSTTPPSGYTFDSGFSTPFEFGCITGGTEVAVNSNFRSGGGFSRYYAQPSWQASAVNAYVAKQGVSFPPSTYYNAANRAIPDVSMWGAGIGIVIGGMITEVGGTSLSSPLFAVVVSLLNEVSLNAGGSTLGFLNPAAVLHGGQR